MLELKDIKLGEEYYGVTKGNPQNPKDQSVRAKIFKGKCTNIHVFPALKEVDGTLQPTEEVRIDFNHSFGGYLCVPFSSEDEAREFIIEHIDFTDLSPHEEKIASTGLDAKIDALAKETVIKNTESETVKKKLKSK